MAETLIRPDVKRGRTAESPEDAATILIHRDDLTPGSEVTRVLQNVFELSCELAQHIVWVAGAQGAARVVTRPRSEAERLMNRARATAMLGGLNLTFSLEQQAYKSRRDLRKTFIQVAVNGILLILVLSAVSLAFADGAGSTASQEVAPGQDAGVIYDRVFTPSGAIVDLIEDGGIPAPP